jgi:hypothetical protein
MKKLHEHCASFLDEANGRLGRMPADASVETILRTSTLVGVTRKSIIR